MRLSRTLAYGVLSASFALLSVAPFASCASSDKAEGSSTKSQSQNPGERGEDPDYESTSSDGDRAARSEKSSSDSNAGDASVSDEEIDQFIRISQKLQKLKMETQKAAKNASSRQEKKKIQENAKKRMKTIFSSEDMTRQEYRQLAKRMQSDRELQRRMKKRMQEKRR